jgi:hypothetical protein
MSGHRSPLNYYVPGLCVGCLGGMTLPATGAGRSELRGTRLGAAMDALTEWAIRRTWKAIRQLDMQTR